MGQIWKKRMRRVTIEVETLGAATAAVVAVAAVLTGVIVRVAVDLRV